MEMLGHSEIGTTMDLYAHVLEPPMQDAADSLDALLGGGGK